MNRHTRRGASCARDLLRTRNGGLTHQIAVLLGVIAILIQGLGVQAHIHSQRTPAYFGVAYMPASARAITQLYGTQVVETRAAPQDKSPIDDGTANCPLCQEFSHFGQFIHGSFAVVGLPFLIAVGVVVFAEISISASAVSHIWRGRAPPKT